MSSVPSSTLAFMYAVLRFKAAAEAAFAIWRSFLFTDLASVFIDYAST